MPRFVARSEAWCIFLLRRLYANPADSVPGTEGTEGTENGHKRRNGVNGGETERPDDLGVVLPGARAARSAARRTPAAGARAHDSPSRLSSPFGLRWLRFSVCAIVSDPS